MFLIKGLKELYIENYRTFIKEIEEERNNGKIFCAGELEESI